jgi:hypothetical protein
MEPLQLAAAAGLCVVITRHERKSGGDVGDSGRGSSAYSGAVDVVLALRRPEGNTRDTLREIHALSRFPETPDRLVIELTEHGYVAHGDPGAVAEKEAREAVLNVLPDNEGDGLTTDQIVTNSGAKRATVQRAINHLEETGLVAHIGAGKKGDPKKYYRPRSPLPPPPDQEDSAQTATEFGRNESEGDSGKAGAGGPDDEIGSARYTSEVWAESFGEDETRPGEPGGTNSAQTSDVYRAETILDQMLCRMCRSPLPTPAQRAAGVHDWCNTPASEAVK